MAYSNEQWDIVRAFFEEGLSLSEIVDRDEVIIKDKSSISRRSNKEGWIKGKNATLTAIEIETKQSLEKIKNEKSTFNATALEIHNTIVDERSKHIQFFTEAAVKNVKAAVDKIDLGTSQAEHRMLADTILKGRETVLGKAPDTAIQINNNQSNRTINTETLTLEQQRAIASITING